MFELHPRLAADTAEVTRLALSRVLLMDERAVPWLILVPQREGLREVHHLAAAERAVLMEEVAQASRVLEALYRPDKINVGALGNLVPQLHVHVMGRFATDRAWPGPFWGSGAPEPYPEPERQAALERLRAAFTGR